MHPGKEDLFKQTVAQTKEFKKFFLMETSFFSKVERDQRDCDDSIMNKI